MLDKESLKDYAKFTSSVYNQLSSLGWYMPGTSETPFLIEIYKLFQNDKIATVDRKMVAFIEANMKVYTHHINKKLVSRRNVFNQVSKAHKQKQYYLSIPAIYSQLDGICEEYFGARLFKIKKNIPVMSRYIKSFDNEFLELMLSSFSNITEQNRLQNKANISGSNRHDILHGTSTNYGTKTNSCKAYSLLFDVIDLISLKSL